MLKKAAKDFGVALSELMNLCRAAGFWKLLSRVFVENERSRRLLASVGFREVGTYHRHGKLEGQWRDVVILATVGIVTGFAYGALLDVWDWTTFYRGAPGFGWQPGLSVTAALGRFGRFYLATSLVYDSFRAAGNAIAVVVLGAPVLAGLIRMRARFNVVVLRSPPQRSAEVTTS